MSAVMAQPTKRIHCPVKALGENFYPFMYGQYRSQRMQAMAEARASQDVVRKAWVKAARKFNRECLWYLRHMVRREP